MFRQAPSFPYHDLGIVEDGTTASRAISKDAYVIWKGASYFASTDILQGATLEEDVNLTAIPDGVINGVVSALNNKINRYSSSEIECGTWVDGKTLYRKVITFTTGSTTEAWLAQSHNISNVANIRITNAYINTSIGNDAVPSSYFQIGVNTTQIMYVIHNSLYGGKEIVVIVEYTKT